MLYLKNFFELGQVARPVAGDQSNILQAHAAKFRVVKAGFNSHHVTGLQYARRMRAQARPIYDQILKVDPENWVALNNMAYILAEEGKDLDQALTMIQRAKQKQPNEPNISDTMGWIYIKKNLSDPAIQIYRELTAKDGSVSTWHYHLGMALYQRGDKVEAKKALAVALSKNPPMDEAGKIKELLAKIG